jgi:hypothetical protein
MKPVYFFTALLLLASTVTFSQGTYLGGTYSIGIPVGGLEKYISAASYRGLNFEGVKEFNSKFAVGWLLGWSVFSEKRKNDVYTDDNLTLTGTQYRYMNLFPMLVRGLYEFGEHEGTRPFIGSGLGVTYDIARTNVGLFSFQKTGWHFTVAPEIGMKIPLGYANIIAGLRYSYGVKTKELGGISYFSINLGLIWGE